MRRDLFQKDVITEEDNQGINDEDESNDEDDNL